MEEEGQELRDRCTNLTKQNDLLHSEAEKFSAQIVTLTQPQDFPSLRSSQEEEEGRGSEQLWELIRFVRREKEIAETKREMSESECIRLRQRADHLQRKLMDTEQQLQELSEAARVREREREREREHSNDVPSPPRLRVRWQPSIKR